MKLREWQEILAAFDDVSGLIRRAFDDRTAPADLDDLRRSLVARLDALRLALGPFMPAEQAVKVLVPLIFLFDEIILENLGKISPSQDLLWSSEEGGDIFFDRVDELCQDPAVPEIIIEVHLFCLIAGFKGRWANDPSMIERYQDQLRERLGVPELPPAEEETALPKTPPLWRSILFTVLGILGIQVVFLLVALLL